MSRVFPLNTESEWRITSVDKMGDFSNIHISAGSYGHILYGFELKISNDAEKVCLPVLLE